jgi:hypothetical protein
VRDGRERAACHCRAVARKRLAADPEQRANRSDEVEGDEVAPIQMQLGVAGKDAGSVAPPGARATEDAARRVQMP